MSRVRVFCGCSVDGFIAGPNDELDWLSGDPIEGETEPQDHHGFWPFLAEVGSLLMGRRTYDVVTSFEGSPWHYGERPVLVATRRPISPTERPVRAVEGTIAELIEEARAAAGAKDVYIDGGNLIRQALDAGLVDELTITLVPIVIGAGIPLFTGLNGPIRLELQRERRLPDNAVQLTYRPRKQLD